ncbi:endogenous retrovirus group PABLB member 1 Env polyprotein-like [Bos javanicus]|uniref:endogenous retrovirus group PABLB member 1 Env polyprotein-like n=1 Tax=Bos javanicus TaxID=9906 RepID=UPI002AA630FA|nr:endogenous retrovirus group PABLB member 1 Env polyprotein-like [Bos javanicus]
MEWGKQFLLLGLTNTILSLTTVPAQDNIFISWAHSYVDFHNSSNCWVCEAMPLSVMDGLPWWVSLLCYGDFIPLCSFLKQQKGIFLSLTNHNLSLLSWCKKKPSVGWGHRVTFNMNTSLMEVTRAYTSYIKNKKERGSLTKDRQASWYLEQYYQTENIILKSVG